MKAEESKVFKLRMAKSHYDNYQQNTSSSFLYCLVLLLWDLLGLCRRTVLTTQITIHFDFHLTNKGFRMKLVQFWCICALLHYVLEANISLLLKIRFMYKLYFYLLFIWLTWCLILSMTFACNSEVQEKVGRTCWWRRLKDHSRLASAQWEHTPRWKYASLPDQDDRSAGAQIYWR